MEELPKHYKPQETEDRIYKTWQDSGYFNPDKLPGDRQKTFTITLPPPNVTGTLHTGHAIMLAIEDILIRYKRMAGFKALWVPGTDSAAIATQSKVEKLLYKASKQSRHDLGREAFLKRVEDFAQDSHDTIIGQVKKMGASLDWSREAYTLDGQRVNAVNTAFKRMYDAGLIYRGNRIVNWDPRMQSTVSDVEIEYIEQKTPFYYFKYGPFTIGTVRPETKFGDKYVVMHPDDDRYKQYEHGQKIELEWINGPITATIIKDEAADMEKGSGVMTITPAHSGIDFEIAQRHNLDIEQVIDFNGKLLPIAGEFAGLHIKKARQAIVEKMQAKGLIEKVDEDYTNNLATNSRGGETLEPQIKEQWFVAMNKPLADRGNKSLAQLMREAVSNGDITILPERFEKQYYHWVDNLHDWNISRQIWYGHRIPVWYKGDEIYCDVTPPEGGDWTQDEDTLDTWFSSGLWTFSTLGWPEDTADLQTYHPTDVLETGYDILTFWVARMIPMSLFLRGEIPFKTVYLHGLVRDEKGRKMSKSLGNIVDPLDLIDQFGADALRMALIVGVGPGSDSNLSNDKIKAYKHFANKIWNASRFVLMNIEDFDHSSIPELVEQDQQYIDELDALIKDVTSDMDNYRFYLAAEKLYHYFWHTFADKIIEDCKTRINDGATEEKLSAQYTLLHILKTMITLLHPFMPFITEEIWSKLPGTQELLIVEKWPQNTSI